MEIRLNKDNYIIKNIGDVHIIISSVCTLPGNTCKFIQYIVQAKTR